MKNQKCPKCGAKKDSSKGYACLSVDLRMGPINRFKQSDLCRERVKVARLKKRLKYITDLAWKFRIENERLQDENNTLRNPNF